VPDTDERVERVTTLVAVFCALFPLDRTAMFAAS
jgi:hypothetical protein